MHRLVVIGLGLLLAGAQDPAEKARALIEKLSSDEIAERETAQTDLVKLGASAVPALRDRLGRAEGEVKTRIQAILDRIERNEKIANLLAPGPLVTLSAKDRPAAEVLTEIGKQGKVVVECRDLPAGTIVSVDAKGVTPAAAIDDLCRAHGKLMYSWSPDRVVILSAPYRRVPSFDRGPFRLVMDGMTVILQGKPPTHADVTLTSGIIGPAGRIPMSVTLVIERFADDKSGDLAAAGPVEIPRTSNDYPLPPVKGPEIFRFLHSTFLKPVSLEATKVTIRGYASLKFPVGLKRRVTVAAPAAGSTGTTDDTTLEIRAWDRIGQRVRASWRRIDKQGGGAAESCVFVLEDAKGGAVEGAFLYADPSRRPLPRMARGTKPATIADEMFEFVLPEGFEPAALVYSSVEVVEEVRIPFEIQEALR